MAQDPRELHAHGVHLAQQRRFEEALDLFRQAYALDADQPDLDRHIAQACNDAGRWSEAESAWKNMTERHPDSVDAFRQLGHAYKRGEKFEPAIDAYRKAIEKDAASPGLQVDLGIVLAQAKRHREAHAAFEKAIELQNDYYEAYLNLGMLLQEVGQKDEAVEKLNKAIELRPDDPNGYNNLGVALAEQGKLDEAIAVYEKLIEKSPDYILGWNNLGNALRTAGRVEEARRALLKAIELRPDYTEAYNNIGIIHTQLEEFTEALRAFDQALLLRPDYPEAHANRGLVYLLMGNFQQGWSDYEWRWQGTHGMKRRAYPGKLWDGSPLAGKRLLLYYEQGLGDTFHFIRYAKELKARGATIVFECQPNMRQILDRTPGIDEFVIRGEKPPVCDFYAPLLSLPGLCQTNLDNLPHRVPYVFADPALIWEWKQRLASIPGFRIGIVWRGNPQHKGDRNRSIPLRCFEVLARIPGVTLITLQKNFGLDELEHTDGQFKVLKFDGIAEDCDGWQRTAAIMSNLDLLITADTSVAHLAAAMGLPVWVALQMSPDWRWLLKREDTPWYPTMRLFRQARPGDWDEVFSRIAAGLAERLAASSERLNLSSNEIDERESQALVKKAADLLSKDQHEEAQRLLEEAVRLDQSSASAQQDLGVMYAKQGRLNDAIKCFRRALAISPDSAGLHANLGLACYHTGQIEESVSHLRRALWLGACSADTHKNLGRALMVLPDPAAAEESFWAALKLKPDDAECHYGLSRVLLAQGKYEQGWLENEWRWKWKKIQQRQHRVPRWMGQSLWGKTVLLVGEDDPRDLVRFVRYAELIRERGGRVVIECQQEFSRLMSGCLGVNHVVASGSSPGPYDFVLPIGSLPAVFQTTLQSIPAKRPYLGADAAAFEAWSKRLKLEDGQKVGLAVTVGELPPSSFKQLYEGMLSMPNVHLVDFTSGGGGIEDTTRNMSAVRDLIAEKNCQTDYWGEIAAAIRNLDHLISGDNIVAHIGCAAGIRTSLILPALPHPLWHGDGNLSPWYPTARLFRLHSRANSESIVDKLLGSIAESAEPTPWRRSTRRGEKCAVATLVTSDEFRRLGEVTLPSHKAYADTIGAEFVVMNRRIFPHPHYDKWQLHDLFDEFDRILFIDADAIVRHDCPDVFLMVPPECVAGENELLSYPKQAEHLADFSVRMGSKTPSCPFYLNAGVFVASRRHQAIFRQPEAIYSDLPWPEQSHFNYRLITENVPVHFLPSLFNDRWRRKGYLRRSFILHYSCMTIDSRMEAATKDLAQWRRLSGKLTPVT